MLTRLAPWYLVFQGLGVLGWWIGLLSSEGFRDLFEMGRPEVLGNFFFADIVLAFISMAAGLSMSVPTRWTPVVLGLTLGGFGYATLLTFTWVGYADSGYLGTLAMSLGCLATLCCLLIEVRRAS